MRVEPTLISVLHWGRLLEGELFATSRYVEWAVLMKRSFGFDALACPECSAKMRAIATLTLPHVVRKILQHLRVRADPLPLSPARDPTGQTEFDFTAAKQQRLSRPGSVTFAKHIRVVEDAEDPRRYPFMATWR